MTKQVTLLSGEQLQKDEAKRQLLESMMLKRQDVMQKLGQFMRNDVHEKQDYITLAKGIIHDIDAVLTQNDYESSLFLRNTVKSLHEMRRSAVNLLTRLDEQAQLNNPFATPVLEKDMSAVYILVFQQQGYDLNKWAQLLRGLGHYVLGRPIYLHEADAQKVIRIKMSEAQEGYVKVAVPQAAIQACSGMSPRSDRYGNALLTLPAGTVSSQNILEFSHGKKRYYFREGELIDVSISTKCD